MDFRLHELPNNVLEIQRSLDDIKIFMFPYNVIIFQIPN